MENPNKDSLIKSIAEIVVSDPKKVIGLLNRHGFKTNLDTNVNDLGKITIVAISKSKKFAEHLADMIIDGKFSANGDKEGTVILMGRTFGAKNPFYNAKGEGMSIEGVTTANPFFNEQPNAGLADSNVSSVQSIQQAIQGQGIPKKSIDNNLTQNQVAIEKAVEKASEAANENVLGDSGMSIGAKIGIALVAVTVIVAGLKIAKVI